MFKKQLLALAVVAALAPSAHAAKVGGVNIDGWVLFEAWTDQHNYRTGQTGPSSEPNVFTLHNINFSNEGKLDDGLTYEWKVANRNRNGNFGGSGATGWREAYLGFNGGFGSVKFGRMLTKAWEIPDYPYGSPFWLAEAMAETGAADWVTTRAIRYTLPDLVDGLTLEGTYDVGQSSANASARLYEVFARYTVGALALDAVVQKKSDSPITLGVGEYGSDGNPSPSAGQNQQVTFLGARYNFGGGLDATLAYKKNEWHNDAGNAGFPGFFHGATPGKDVSNSRIMAGLTYRWDKWRVSGAYQKVTEGKDSTAGGLNDGAQIIGVQVARQLAQNGAQAYIGLRHTTFDGTNLPIDAYPWQMQNAGSGATSANTRIGIGTWVPF
jgi:Gram-negative porin